MVTLLLPDPSPAPIARCLEKGDRRCPVFFKVREPDFPADLPGLVAQVKGLGYPDIGVLSDGHRICEAGYARGLISAGVNRFAVFLHGSKRRVHDGQTGRPGSFEQAVGALDLLAFLRRKMQHVMLMSMTLLTPRNLHDMRSTLHLSLRRKVDAAVMLPSQAKEEMVPYRRIVDFLSAMRADLENDSVTDLDKIKLLDVPSCLMAGLKEHKSDGRSLPVEDFPRVKSPGCARCPHGPGCPGVRASYVAARGWSEFGLKPGAA